MPTLENCSMLLYGPPKIGKSTFCGGLDKVVFLDFEGGLTWIEDIESKIKTISSWKEMQALVKEMQDSGKIELDNGKTIRPIHLVMDTVDIAWIYCTEYVCKKFGFEHPSDEGYGKGYQVLRYEFQKQLARLNVCKSALVLVSHSKAIEIRGRGSNRTSQIVPTIPNSAREVVLPMMDIIGYCGFDIGEDDEERAIMFAPEEGLEAGDRSGKLPKIMPLRTEELDKYFGGDKPKPESRKRRGRRRKSS